MTNAMSTATTNPRVARMRALAAVTASKKTGDILPRQVYTTAGVTPPKESTGVIQRRKRAHR